MQCTRFKGISDVQDQFQVMDDNMQPHTNFGA